MSVVLCFFFGDVACMDCQVLNGMVKADLGELLEVPTLLDIFHTVYKIGRHVRTSDVLKRTSDMFLLEMVSSVMRR